MRADGGTVPLSTRRPRRGGGGTERGSPRAGQRHKERNTRRAGRDRQTRGPRPTTHRRTGHAEASPTGAREGAPEPTTAAARLGNGHPPREERESAGAAGRRRRLPTGPSAPPTPGTEEATPPGVFKPTRRNAVARYPDRVRGWKTREGGTPRRRRARSRPLARRRLRPARAPGSHGERAAGRRREALPFPPDGGGTGRAPPPRNETEQPDGKEATHPRAAAVR